MSKTKISTEKMQLHLQLSASELSAIIMKGSNNSNDRDAGFCSGSSDGGDDLSNDHSRIEPSSPTDASEDSVEVKVTPILFGRNKRKSSEPSKVIASAREEISGPLKKRIRYTSGEVNFLPVEAKEWDRSHRIPHELMPNPAQVFVRHPGATTLHRLPNSKNSRDIDVNSIENYVQDEPLALVLKKPPMNSNSTNSACSSSSPPFVNERQLQLFNQQHQEHLQQHRVKEEIFFNDLKTHSCESPIPSNTSFLGQREVKTPSVISSNEDSIEAGHQSSGCRLQQRNYKNMTRERRIEANARERTRVHTISAAYETLRKAVPSYSNSQKLSKLSVLRVACSYILTLSRMAGEDYSEDQSAPSIASCIEAVTATIQTEGKIRKKKEE